MIHAAAPAEPIERVGEQRIDLLLCAHGRDSTLGPLLDRVAGAWPAAPRVLMALHRDLPEIARELGGRVTRVIPRRPSREALRQALPRPGPGPAHRDEDDGAAAAPPAGAALSWEEARALLGWTATRIVGQPGVVIRDLDPDVPRVELVAPRAALAAVEAALAQVWGDAPVADRLGRQRVTRHLGGVTPGQRIFVRQTRAPAAHLYLALLPWRDGARATIALGLLGAPTAVAAAAVACAYGVATEHALDYPLPSERPDSRGRPRYLPEHGWVLTRGYLGPDRRRRPTAFLGRYLLGGRRRQVPAVGAAPADLFVDRLSSSALRLFAAYLALVAIDCALTLWLVRAGRVGELNPVLRPLLAGHPLGFLLAKNGLALGAFLLAARFELVRPGRRVLWLLVVTYALLDGYWLALLSSGAPRGSGAPGPARSTSARVGTRSAGTPARLGRPATTAMG